tara:strand:+ start:807 stop:1001 length:195 start_codon:yes stop_codon:yes gene_type:complete
MNEDELEEKEEELLEEDDEEETFEEVAENNEDVLNALIDLLVAKNIISEEELQAKLDEEDNEDE